MVRSASSLAADQSIAMGRSSGADNCRRVPSRPGAQPGPQHVQADIEGQWLSTAESADEPLPLFDVDSVAHLPPAHRDHAGRQSPVSLLQQPLLSLLPPPERCYMGSQMVNSQDVVRSLSADGALSLNGFGAYSDSPEHERHHPADHHQGEVCVLCCRLLQPVMPSGVGIEQLQCFPLAACASRMVLSTSRIFAALDVLLLRSRNISTAMRSAACPPWTGSKRAQHRKRSCPVAGCGRRSRPGAASLRRRLDASVGRPRVARDELTGQP